jgi:hypothetical protein
MRNMTMTRIFAPMPTYFGRQPHKTKGVGASPIVTRQPRKVMVGNEIALPTYAFKKKEKRNEAPPLLHGEEQGDGKEPQFHVPFVLKLIMLKK